MTEATLTEPPVVTAPRRAERSFFLQLIRKPQGAIPLAVLALIILACVFAPLLTSYGPLDQNLTDVMSTPTSHHILGTDTLGRDVFSRLLYGGRSSLLGVAIAIAVWAAVGIPLGLVMGYFGGLVDRLASPVIDLFQALPNIVIILAVLAVFDKSLVASMLTLGILSSVGLARVVRAATINVRDELYVSAAKVAGLGAGRILVRHILPRVTGPIVVQVSLFAGAALITQTGLGFLGLGVQAPQPTWGNMVGDAANVIDEFGWLLIPSGGIIAITILACGLIGDAARDVTAEKQQRASTKKEAKRTRLQADASRVGRRGDADTAESDLRDGRGAVLQVDDLHVEFTSEKGATEIVHGISLRVAPREIVGLVGESGSGKTVVSLSLLGLLPSNAHVSAQVLRVGEHDLLSLDERSLSSIRGREIAYISQEPMVSLDPVFSVGSLLREVIRRHHRGMSKAEVRERALQLLSDVKLPNPDEVLRKYPFELSGGMAQRVVIAMALVGNPKVLLADEPTTALDVTVQAEILDLLRDLRDRFGMAIIIVTHDLGVVADLCDHVEVMQYGTIVERGETVQLFQTAKDPYTQQLLASTPSLIGART